jgi:hypothetical protein
MGQDVIMGKMGERVSTLVYGARRDSSGLVNLMPRLAKAELAHNRA